MKNRTLHYLSLTACALLILSSCGTSNKYSKNQGFGGGFGEGESLKVAKSAPATPASAENTTSSETPEITSTTVEASAPAASAVSTSNEKSAPTATKKKNASKIGLKQQIQIAKELKHAAKSADAKAAPKETNESTIVFILLFILCFIIPPLAYILHKGAADMWFWIDLILFLFAISWLFGVSLGLAGLASVVIALLGLFDVI